ncbi:MAG: hypothetical protein Q7J44_22745 [Pseudotabrizicola sp.]|uniref:hypothetical protein n=1 Tax=Pseudotabrizicola sp. TaxID=2939647 RepID=UPI00271DEAFA|nr:hypothetical protein [Pseudotabrizicola sp.]MDO9641354.1 hypothetical protein [Pseudotabrizicola sp.]
MTHITIKDRPCGWGKSTEIFSSYKAGEKYITVLPFLSEVDRAVKRAASESKHIMYAPVDTQGSKTDHVTDLIKAGKSVACTHALFFRLGTLATTKTGETLDIVGLLSDAHNLKVSHTEHFLLDDFHVIIDEAIDPFNTVNTVTPNDFQKDYVELGLVEVCPDGKISPTGLWDTRYRDGGQTFDRSLYEQAKSGALYTVQGKLFVLTIPTELMLRPKSVTIYTYLSGGTVLLKFMQRLQQQLSDTSDAFTLEVDRLAPVDEAAWRQDVSRALLINSIPALESYNWSYSKQLATFSKSGGKVAARRVGMALKHWAGKELAATHKGTVMLTCARDLWCGSANTQQPMAGPLAKDSRLFGNAVREYDEAGFADGWSTTGVKFVANTTRGVNDYILCGTAIYLYDQHPNPNVTLFLGMPKGSKAEREFSDAYALSELVQWLFRSCIRSGGMNSVPSDIRPRRKAVVYIPSARMRNLLINWLATGEVCSMDRKAFPTSPKTSTSERVAA